MERLYAIRIIELILPISTILLIIIITYAEMSSKYKRDKKKKYFIYTLSGLTLSIITAITTLVLSQQVIVKYNVDRSNIYDSEEINYALELPKLYNNGFYPVIVTITSRDQQLFFSQDELFVHANSEINTHYVVNAMKTGHYTSSVRIGIFYPFLPKKVLYALVKKSYWLALLIISIVPGLPFMVYPLIKKNR